MQELRLSHRAIFPGMYIYIFNFKSNLLCICVYDDTCHGMYREVRGQLEESFPTMQGSNSHFLAWQQMFLPAEPSYWPLSFCP